MADWLHDLHRYIYRTSDPQWMALPASTRSLAAELLRWVDDDGAIYLRPGEEAWDAIARVMQAGRADAAWVKRGTKQLLGEDADFPDEDHLELATNENKRLVRIRNFKVAQGITESAVQISARRKWEAERKAQQRAAKRENGPPPEDPPPVPDLSGTLTANVPDKSRTLQWDTRAGAPAQAPAQAPVGAHASAPASRTRPRSVPYRSVPCLSNPDRPDGGEEILRTELGDLAALAGDLRGLARQLAAKGADLDVVTEAAMQVVEAPSVRNVAALMHSKVDQLLPAGALAAALDKRHPERIEGRRIEADRARAELESRQAEERRAEQDRAAQADYEANRREGETVAAYRRRLGAEARDTAPSRPEFGKVLTLAKTGTS